MKYGRTRTSATVSKRTMLVSGALSAALLFGGATFVAHEAIADQGKSFSEIVKQVQGYDFQVLHPDATPRQLKDLYPGSATPKASFSGLAREIQLYEVAVLHPDANDAKLKQLYPQANITKAAVTEFKAQLQKEAEEKAAAQHQDKFNRDFKRIAKQVLEHDIKQLHPNATPEELNKLYSGKLADEIAKKLGTDKAPEKNAVSGGLPTLNDTSGNKATADTKDAKAKEEGTKPADAKKDAATNNTKPADGAKPAEAATPADTAALAGDQSLATAPNDAQAANTKLASTGDMPLAAIPVVGAVLAGAVLFMRSRFVR